MAIGERIRFMRNLRGMTQKWLGQAVGFTIFFITASLV